MSKYNIGLKTSLQDDPSELEFYGDYKFRDIVHKNWFFGIFQKDVTRYKNIGYNIDILHARLLIRL